MEELNHEIKCLNVLTTDSQNCSFYDESPHSDEEIVEIISSCFTAAVDPVEVLIEKLLKEEPKIFLQRCVSKTLTLQYVDLLLRQINYPGNN